MKILKGYVAGLCGILYRHSPSPESSDFGASQALTSNPVYCHIIVDHITSLGWILIALNIVIILTTFS